MRTTVTISDEKLRELIEATESSNKTVAINRAVDFFLRERKKERLLALKGRVAILDNEAIESMDDVEFGG